MSPTEPEREPSAPSETGGSGASRATEDISPPPVPGPSQRGRGRGGLARRLPGLLLVGVAVAAFLLFGPKLPREQPLRVSLGENAPSVREIVLRYRPSSGDLTDDVLREVSFRFPKGDAPRLLRHEPRLVDGEYVLEIEVVTNQARATIKRDVGFFGGASSIDIGSAISGLSAPGLDAGGTP